MIKTEIVRKAFKKWIATHNSPYLHQTDNENEFKFKS